MVPSGRRISVPVVAPVAGSTMGTGLDEGVNTVDVPAMKKLVTDALVPGGRAVLERTLVLMGWLPLVVSCSFPSSSGAVGCGGIGGAGGGGCGVLLNTAMLRLDVSVWPSEFTTV